MCQHCGDFGSTHFISPADFQYASPAQPKRPGSRGSNMVKRAAAQRLATPGQHKSLGVANTQLEPIRSMVLAYMLT